MSFNLISKLNQKIKKLSDVLSLELKKSPVDASYFLEIIINVTKRYFTYL